MNYKNVATAVFTPLELGTVGLTEEEAINMYVFSAHRLPGCAHGVRNSYGADAIDCYISNFTPLEFAVLHLDGNPCYAKVVINVKDGNRVLGMHIACPNAGEIIQGYAVAVKKGITFEVRALQRQRRAEVHGVLIGIEQHSGYPSNCRRGIGYIDCVEGNDLCL